MRINKYLSEAGHCSRREADRLIAAGSVSINGKKAVLGDDVKEGDVVRAGGKLLSLAQKKIYIAFHKPVGAITTTDARSKNTVMDALKRSSKRLPPVRVFPIGRLDVASSGLLILTNDNDLANTMMRPEGKVEKEYDVAVDRDLTGEFLEKMSKGVRILGIVTRPAKVERTGPRTFLITLTEGKNRQIRRMCEALGCEVRRLRRVRVGDVRLGDLSDGEWRFLTEKEIASLRRRVV